ncbi:MAG: hypothetical protein KC503_18375 [Myxococcales bacterium]|nr:hypothetical protein [Myxococcales bacterium]
MSGARLVIALALVASSACSSIPSPSAACATLALSAWPNNDFTRPDATSSTGLRVALGHDAIGSDALLSMFPGVRTELEKLDGFGTMASLVFHIAGPIDAQRFAVTPEQSTAVTSPLALVALDSGEAVPLVIDVVEDPRADNTKRVLLARPLVPLSPATTYAAMVRASSGETCLDASAAMRLAIDGLAPPDAGVTRAKKVLVDGGFIADSSELAALTVFTTQSIRAPTSALVSDVEAYAASTGALAISNVSDLGPRGTHVAHVLRGTFEATHYRGASGLIAFDADNKPTREARVDIAFDLYLPDASAAAAPFPVAILTHGLNGTRQDVAPLAERFAAIGVASIAIDAPDHGARLAPGHISIVDFFGLDLASKTFEIGRVRDSFRQAYADLLQLSRLVTRAQGIDLLPLGQPDGVPEIKASEVMVVGHSLGGILGSGLLALDARCAVGALAGAGAGLTNIVLESGLLGAFVNALKRPGVSDADIRAFFPLLQTIFERGDPGNYAYALQRAPYGAPAATSLKHVLYLAVQDDRVVPNSTSEALARAAGVPQLPPVLSSVVGLPLGGALPISGNGREQKTAGYFQYDRFGDKKATHGDVTTSVEPQAQLVHFLETYLASGVPEIIDPYVVLGLK